MHVLNQHFQGIRLFIYTLIKMSIIRLSEMLYPPASSYFQKHVSIPAKKLAATSGLSDMALHPFLHLLN